jgi:hypothetical protein
MRKEMKDETRKRIEDDLKASAALYANHAESKISKFQQAYLKKYHLGPLEVLRRPDGRNQGFGGKMSALFRGRREDLRVPETAYLTKSEEGIADITHGFQVSLLSQPPELVPEDDCRNAVYELNHLRGKRAENLGDGYQVSSAPCYNIDSCYVTNSVS